MPLNPIKIIDYYNIKSIVLIIFKTLHIIILNRIKGRIR